MVHHTQGPPWTAEKLRRAFSQMTGEPPMLNGYELVKDASSDLADFRKYVGKVLRRHGVHKDRTEPERNALWEEIVDEGRETVANKADLLYRLTLEWVCRRSEHCSGLSDLRGVLNEEIDKLRPT